MIVVMPNGRAQKNDRLEGNVVRSAPAFAVFETDLLNDLITAIESKYSVTYERESRGIAAFRWGEGNPSILDCDILALSPRSQPTLPPPTRSLRRNSFPTLKKQGRT
jgi:hypothetical protein